ncbi:subtilisin-like protein [Atractiella rhizophila]|nr:subtilisin-like protein [Atractiella rhizophila]
MMKLAAVLALAIPALAAPTVRNNDHKIKRAANPIPGQYIVKLKDGASKAESISVMSNAVSTFGSEDGTVGQVIYDQWKVLNGYAAKLGGAALDQVKNDPNVEFIEEDGIITIDYKVSEGVSAADVKKFMKRQSGTGEGVNIYSVDTGVYIEHEAFGGRATWGTTFGGYADADGNGHGTHTMGTAAGEGYGPATSASIIAVKVLSDSGSGSFSDVISGIDWAASAATDSGKPSVINMSLGGGASSSVDAAVQGAIDSNVPVSIAAGNSNVDASTTSPARVQAAITVGAVDSSNVKASFSNYGPVLDVWELGVNVLSTYIGSPSATATLSGTSMAAPGVAGIVAVALSEKSYSSVADLVSALTAAADPVVDTDGTDSTNLLAVLF